MSRVCEICGGPIGKDNKIGICTKNKLCQSENTRKRKARNNGTEYVPLSRGGKKCAGCGRYLHNRSQNKYCRVNPECFKNFLQDQYQRKRESSWARRTLNQAKLRAKKRNQPFTITLSDLPPIPDKCPALGIPITVNMGVSASNSVTLDCIVPTLGYVPGNIQWLSYKANSMKRDATPDELRRFAKWILTG